jgi:hypothetical protein
MEMHCAFPSCLTGESRYPPPTWIPTFVGKTIWLVSRTLSRRVDRTARGRGKTAALDALKKSLRLQAFTDQL